MHRIATLCFVRCWFVIRSSRPYCLSILIYYTMVFGITQELFLPPIVETENCMEIYNITLYASIVLILAIWFIIKEGDD